MNNALLTRADEGRARQSSCLPRRRTGSHGGTPGAALLNILSAASVVLLLLLTTACSRKSDRFTVEGRFENLNQGEFYVYSLGRPLPQGLDTVKINAGRFKHSFTIDEATTLMFVFQNFSEQPVFAEPGKSVTLSADATHLREMEVSGTRDNRLMTRFRKEAATLSPPDITARAETFIREHPSSPVSRYLFRRYFILDADAERAKVSELAQIVGYATTASPAPLLALRQYNTGDTLPPFDITDTRGRHVTSADTKGKITVVSTFAVWNHESLSMLRQIRPLVGDNSDRLTAISISLDAARNVCDNALRRDTLPWPVVCDGMMFDSPALTAFGLCRIPDNVIIAADGTIAARSLTTNQLKTTLEELLQQ